MTPEQLAAIKAYIDATPELAAQPLNSDGAFAIAADLNKVAVPDFVVWRTSVMQDEITASDGFNWTLVDGLSAGAARIWEWLFENSSRSINAGKPNVRQGVDDVWKGTAAKVLVKEAVLAVCKRKATVCEKVLATGTGTTQTPATMSFEGSISYSDVAQARQS